MSCRERAVVRAAGRACSSIHSRAICVALQRVGAAVARELDQLADLHLERGLQREAERPALVQKRRHRDLPAAADLAEQVLGRHATSVKKISLNSASPVIWRSGRTSTPGECMSTIR